MTKWAAFFLWSELRCIVHRATLNAMDTLLIPRLELELRSGNGSSTCFLSSVALDPDQQDCSGNTDGLVISVSIGFVSSTKFNKIDATQGNGTNEIGLLIPESGFDRQRHIQYRQYVDNGKT